MSTATLWLLLALVKIQAVEVRPITAPPVNVAADDVSICPDGHGDCHLTTVDNNLCIFLAELLNPLTQHYRDRYNCDMRDEGIYACVNVLGRRPSDLKAGTDYTYPYLIELAEAYERQLDKCLRDWQKKNSIARADQSIIYSYDRREVTLSIVPFERSGVRYDRLLLRIRDETIGK